jgi:hypothetical protein
LLFQVRVGCCGAMDISGMSEEEQLRAAMNLSMQDSSVVFGASGAGGGAPAAASPAPLQSRGKPRTFPGKDSQDLLACTRARLGALRAMTWNP